MAEEKSVAEELDVTLRCGVYGEGSVFTVKIRRNADVEALQKAIFDKKRYSERYKFDASMLTLYLARKKGDTKWMKDDDNLDIFLRGSVDTQFMKLRSSWRLDEKEVFGENFQPESKDIHVLVELPEAASPPSVTIAVPSELSEEDKAAGLVLVKMPSGNKKQRMSWRSTGRGPHNYDKSSRLFLLEDGDMEDSGLPPHRLTLFCRPIFHEQFKFLDEQVLKNGRLGWIIGPPGTGKSTTTLAFTSTMDREKWIVTWIHVDMWETTWSCVRLMGDERQTRSIDINDVDEVLQIENESKNHLVIVDGLTAARSFLSLRSKCTDWFLHKVKGDAQQKVKRDAQPKRRLAFVCSMSSRGKVSENLDGRTRTVEFRVWSWTLDEYLEAITNSEIFNQFWKSLNESGDPPTDDLARTAIVTSKYYYAGGSCRYMLEYNTADVVTKLDSAVDTMNNPENATSGQRTLLSINRLFALFQDPHKTMGTVSPVISQYAATQIAVTCGPKAIKKLMSTQKENSNPALDGWMLEMLFFASLRMGGLGIVDAAGNLIESWESKSNVVVLEDVLPSFNFDPVWIKPMKWNQGGYDAIMVCKDTKHVRFVQVTSAHKHSFHIGHFHTWLRKLSETNNFEVAKLEIYFVIEKDKLGDFRFTTVTGTGLLEAFGWKKDKEVDRVRLVGMRGLYNLSV